MAKQKKTKLKDVSCEMLEKVGQRLWALSEVSNLSRVRGLTPEMLQQRSMGLASEMSGMLQMLGWKGGQLGLVDIDFEKKEIILTEPAIQETQEKQETPEQSLLRELREKVAKLESSQDATLEDPKKKEK